MITFFQAGEKLLTFYLNLTRSLCFLRLYSPYTWLSELLSRSRDFFFFKHCKVLLSLLQLLFHETIIKEIINLICNFKILLAKYMTGLTTTWPQTNGSGQSNNDDCKGWEIIFCNSSHLWAKGSKEHVPWKIKLSTDLIFCYITSFLD